MSSITQTACKILNAQSPIDKTRFARQLSQLWHANELSLDFSHRVSPPEHPGRPEHPLLISPREMKRRRLGTTAGRIALLHAIAHIEFNAINLAADMIARYANDQRIGEGDRKAFVTDWVNVCCDEARHFDLLQSRLNVLGSHYGALPAHNGLWEAALSTCDDLAARLVIAPMVLEARGLDVTPTMIIKLKAVNDHESAEILSTIYEDEVGHVAAGTHWFFHICSRENRDAETYFHLLVKSHFKGKLKPPFNTKARELAGMPSTFYQSKPVG